MKSISRTNRASKICLVFSLLLVTVIPTVAASHEFQAGAALVDITPPPGLSTGGHGPVGAVARGHLTRLYARAIFFRDQWDHPLLLVSVESFAVPQIFRSELQREFKQKTGFNLPLESIVIAATHTHQGPGNYLSAAAYNNLGSPIKGFIWQLRDFLIERIVDASVKAFRNAELSKSVTLQIRKTLLPLKSLRNRSPETFMLNASAEDIMKDFDNKVKELGGILAPKDDQSCVKERQNREQDGAWDIVGCPRLRAVNRELTILDVTVSNVRVATVVFGAMHPTVAQPDTPLFSSDFVGLAMRQMELKDPKLVAAFFNGPEGDISARRVERDIRDVWKHASLLRQAIECVMTGIPLDLSNGIESRMHFAEPGERLPGFDVKLAPKPKAGPAAVGGGEGDRTPLYPLGWQERVTDLRATSEQGAKLNAFKSRLLPDFPDFTNSLATSDDFPSALPLGYVRLGVLEIVSTPTEMSTATGYAIRKELGSSVIILGLANEYASYTATADEYPRQDYMAASTLWGPQEAEFFVRALARLKCGPSPKCGSPLPDNADPSDRPGDEWLSPQPFDVGARRQAVDEDLDLILRNEDRNPVRDLPYVTWSDEKPNDPYKEVIGTSVAIKRENGTLFEDDSAGRIIILLREKPKNSVNNWVAIWLARLDDPPVTDHVFFAVKTASGKCYNSPLFYATDKRDRGPMEKVTCPTQ